MNDSTPMPDQEAISGQQELLATYRKTLAFSLKKLAKLGSAQAPSGLLHEIDEARENIRRIKRVLRSWNVQADDHPDDEAPESQTLLQTLSSLPIEVEVPSKSTASISGKTHHTNSKVLTGTLLAYPGLDRHIGDLFPKGHPFSFSKAERMPLEALEATYVAHPGFERHILDLQHSAVLLAPRGGGKTAGRYRLEIELNRRQRQTVHELKSSFPHMPLVVTYNNFERIVRKLPDVDLKHHIDPLMEAVAKAICEFIITYPKRFMAVKEATRSWWWAFMQMFVDGIQLTHRIYDEESIQDLQRAINRPAPFKKESTLESMLEDLCRQLSSVGFDSLFVLLDGIDGYVETQNRSNQEALIAPLLNTIPLLSIQEVIWKFFLPDELLGVVRSSAGHQNDLLNIVPIQWDEKSLRRLLRHLLEWASEDYIHDIAQICSEELLHTINVEQYLIDNALQHTHLGPPRALLHLGRMFLGEI